MTRHKTEAAKQRRKELQAQYAPKRQKRRREAAAMMRAMEDPLTPERSKLLQAAGQDVDFNASLRRCATDAMNARAERLRRVLV